MGPVIVDREARRGTCGSLSIGRGNGIHTNEDFGTLRAKERRKAGLQKEKSDGKAAERARYLLGNDEFARRKS